MNYSVQNHSITLRMNHEQLASIRQECRKDYGYGQLPVVVTFYNPAEVTLKLRGKFPEYLMITGKPLISTNWIDQGKSSVQKISVISDQILCEDTALIGYINNEMESFQGDVKYRVDYTTNPGMNVAPVLDLHRFLVSDNAVQAKF